MLHLLLFASLAAASAASAGDQVDLAAARLLARVSRSEPSIEEVQRAAGALAAGAVPSWRSRARLAALAPKLTAEYRLDDRRYRVVGLSGGSEVDYVRHTPGTVLAVRLAWDLGDAVFAESELRAAAQAQAQAKVRTDAVERATRVYYRRQKLRLDVAAAPPATARERAERELELEELAAELDALTGGLYFGGRR